MTASLPAPPDAAALAAAVRQLAHHAHRTLNDPSSTDSDLRDLSRRAVQLRRQVRGRTSGSVDRWLDQLERLLADSLVSAN